jgi:signal peptidase I
MSGIAAIDPTNFGPHVVRPDHVFVMGDNRNNSADSRFQGDVPLHRMKARAAVIYWSMDTSGEWWYLSDFVRWSRIGRLIR